MTFEFRIETNSGEMGALAFGPERTAEVVANLRKAAQVNATKVKKDWQASVAGAGHLPGLASAVTYDVKQSAGMVEAEIGYDKSRSQGPLGNVREFGTSNNPPRLDGERALHANVDDLVEGVKKALQVFD